jgi:hypothetical protein
MTDQMVLEYLVKFGLWLLTGINWLYFVLLITYLVYLIIVIKKAWKLAHGINS